MKPLLIFLFICLLCPAVQAASYKLTVLYFKRPPYYDTRDGAASGILVDLTREIMADADIEPIFSEVPPQRILYYLQNPEKKVCSIGWFKTTQREAFAKFSKPIYQNKPLVILTVEQYQHKIENHIEIKDVLFDQTLVMARIDSFSYGAVIDEWINNYAPQVHVISSDQQMLPRLIATGRASYMLVAPEEIHTMLVQANLDPVDFVSISKPDIPKGNKRYLIFSRGIEDAVIEKINASIEKLVPRIP